MNGDTLTDKEKKMVAQFKMDNTVDKSKVEGTEQKEKQEKEKKERETLMREEVIITRITNDLDLKNSPISSLEGGSLIYL